LCSHRVNLEQERSGMSAAAAVARPKEVTVSELDGHATALEKYF